MAAEVESHGVKLDPGVVFAGMVESGGGKKATKRGVAEAVDLEMEKLVADWNKNHNLDLARRTKNLDDIAANRASRLESFKSFHNGSWVIEPHKKNFRPEGVSHKDWHRKKMVDLYKYDPDITPENSVNRPIVVSDSEANADTGAENENYLEDGFYKDLYLASWMDADENKTLSARKRLMEKNVDVLTVFNSVHEDESKMIKKDIILAYESDPDIEKKYSDEVMLARERLKGVFLKNVDSEKTKNEKDPKKNVVSLEEIDLMDKGFDTLRHLERRDEENVRLKKFYDLAPDNELGNEIAKSYFNAVDCLVKGKAYPEFPNKEVARNFLREYFGYKSEAGVDQAPLLDLYKKHAIDYYWSNLGLDREEGLLSLGSKEYYNEVVKARVVSDLVDYIGGDTADQADKRLEVLGYDLEQIKNHSELATAVSFYKDGEPEGAYPNPESAYKYIVNNWEVEVKKNRLYRSEYLHTEKFVNDLVDLYPKKGAENKEKEIAIERKFSTIGIEVLRQPNRKKDYINGRHLANGINSFYSLEVGKVPTDWTRTERLLISSKIGVSEAERAKNLFRKSKKQDKVDLPATEREDPNPKNAEQVTREEFKAVFETESRPTNPAERLRMVSNPEKWANLMAIIDSLDEEKKKRYKLALRVIVYQLEHPEERAKTSGRWNRLYLPFLRQLGVDVENVI